ncbi:Hypothetical predicted protein, partial [Cloeon dipterum]
MLKGKEDAATRSTISADKPDKPRKKLSFREPEIVGHIRKRFAQNQQNALHQQQQQQAPMVVERNNNRVFGRATLHPVGEVGEDAELE